MTVSKLCVGSLTAYGMARGKYHLFFSILTYVFTAVTFCKKKYYKLITHLNFSLNNIAISTYFVVTGVLLEGPGLGDFLSFLHVDGLVNVVEENHQLLLAFQKNITVH